MNTRSLALAATAFVSCTSCAPTITVDVQRYGPLIGINAIVVGGAKEARLHVGDTARMNVAAYYARDTLANLDPT